jgi:putative ABC transport system ATP-binding protein
VSHRSEAVRAEIAAACNDLTKVYQVAGAPVTGLDGVDKEFPAGRVTTVVGPSGSGKSSLLRILALVDRPTTGSVRIRREEVGCVGIRGRRLLRRTEIGYLFQDPSANLVGSLDATEQLRFAGRLRGVRVDQAEIDRLLALLGLSHRARHLPVQLSGGEQQRLAVACSVLGRPSIVIADEPTAELDSVSADRVLAAFADLGGEGVAFVVSSHDPRVVERTDHLLRLERGRPVESW